MYGSKSNTARFHLTMDRLVAVLPHAEMQEFPGLDHFGIDQKTPQEVAWVVSAFLLDEQPAR